MNGTTRVPVSSVRVETEQFEFSHGKAPRGRGLWMFAMGGGVTYEEVGFSGSYSVAKKEAQKYAAAHGYRETKVLP